MSNALGWVKLYRSLLDWEWYDDINTKVLFIHLLLKANHKERAYKGMLIKRGELVTGRIVLSAELGLTEQQIRTSLTKLKSTNEITIKTTNKNSVVSIVNYDLYQDIENDQPTEQPTGNQRITNKQPTDNQQVTTNKNVKNNKNVKKGRKEESLFSFGADAEKEIDQEDSSSDFKQPDQEKEKGSAEKEKETKKITKDDFRQTLINEGAAPQHVADWFVVRDSHKAPYTLTALNKFLNECQNNNYPVSLAVQACAEYNWRGFEYQWIINKQKYVTGQTAASSVSTATAKQDRQQRLDSVERMGELARQIVANAINDGSTGN